MEPYDIDVECSKCGHYDMEDTWFDEVKDQNATPMMRRDRPERIRRKCRNCGYVWDTVQLDLQEEQ